MKLRYPYVVLMLFQEPLSIPAHPTDQVLDSDPAGSDKVLAGSIFSTSSVCTEAYNWLFYKAHAKYASVADTMCMLLCDSPEQNYD